MRTTDDPSLIRRAGLFYFPIALVARVPFAMMIVGVMTLVVSERGSLSLAGATSAFVGAGQALCAPLIGAAADRWGQRSVLLVTAVAESLALVSIVVATRSSASDLVVMAMALLIGAFAPQVSPMSRSRVVGIVERGFAGARHASVLNAAMAYESAADEAVFVFGPVVVGALATAIDPAAPVLGAAALTLVFVAAFALHPSARTIDHVPRGSVPDQAPARELARPSLIVLVVGTLGVGLFFGSMLTSLTAFMEDRGMPEQAGLVYGAMGVSSAAFALAGAWFPTRFTLAARWLTFAGVLCLATASLLLAHSVLAMTILIFIVGIGVGPTLVSLYHLGAHRSPKGRSATVMTMLVSGIVVGQSATSLLTGVVAQQAGTAAALLLPFCSAVVLFIAGLANLWLTRRGAVGTANDAISETESVL